MDVADFGPIDVVYTWVDGSDPTLKAEMGRYKQDLGPENKNSIDGQLRDLGELLFSIRSVKTFMPWVNRIFIVTSGQTPADLRFDSDTLRLVFHQDMFADKQALPVFNSLAIECNLHLIPGLSEHFIYLNNDFFIGSPVSVSDFLPDGRDEFFLLEHRALRSELTDMYSRLLNYNDALLEGRYGNFKRLSCAHTPQIFRRSKCLELAESWADEVLTTSRHRFRAAESFHFRLMYTYSRLYEMFGPMPIEALLGAHSKHTRTASAAEFAHFTASSHDQDMENNLRAALQGRPKFFCIQDHTWKDLEYVRTSIGRALSELLPEPSPFEV